MALQKPKSYTAQLTEPTRIQIGLNLIARELIKINPQVNYDQLVSHLAGKWQFEKSEDVRDFWNLVHSLIAGYKLKRILPKITSAQWHWSLNAHLPIDNIRFTADTNNYELTGKSTSEVKALANYTEFKISMEAYPSAESKKRLEDPIIVFDDATTTEVHDGNGRLFFSLLTEKNSIPAYIGTKTQIGKPNHWIPTADITSRFYNGDRIGLVRTMMQSDNAIREFIDIIPDHERQKELIIKYWDYLVLVNGLSHSIGALPAYLYRMFK